MAILDCGGGTNDMTFIRMVTKKPLVCQELKEAWGGTAGAASIDDSLKGLLLDFFGPERFRVMSQLVSFVEVLDDWETFKVGYEGSDGDSYSIELSN